VSRLVDHEERDRGPTWWLSSLGLFAAIAGGIGGLYALIHAASLGPGVSIPDLIYRYYAALFLVWALFVAALYLASPRPAVTLRGFSAVGYLLLLLLYPFFVDGANVRIVKADTLYKHGYKYDQARTWDSAIHFYSKAIEVRPTEDFYYLFQGRALMERAKLERDPEAQGAYFAQSMRSLKRAKELNPLNTDHTANMARLCRTWAEKEPDAASRAEKYGCALKNYEEATKLSPHNAQLYNEWGLVHYLMGDLEPAMQRYQESLALDQEFVQTYILIGDVHLARQEWDQAAPAYERAVALDDRLVQGWSALGYAYSRLREWDKAIQANMKVLGMAPSDYSTLKNLAILYGEAGKPREALEYATQALVVAPEQDKATLQAFAGQLQARAGKDNP
jgi:tetratricopeptide (TPR) repeat protein